MFIHPSTFPHICATPPVLTNYPPILPYILFALLPSLLSTTSSTFQLCSHSLAAGSIRQIVAASPRPHLQLSSGRQRLQVFAAILLKQTISTAKFPPWFKAFLLVPRSGRTSSSVGFKVRFDPVCEKRALCMKTSAVTAA